MTAVNVYVGNGIFDNRRAIINSNGDKYFVDLYLEDMCHRTVDVSQYSIRYAEDTAENWVTGIIKD